ncbi:hypothetical protein WAI453_003247 [Rhynchosporium graminicola]
MHHATQKGSSTARIAYSIELLTGVYPSAPPAAARLFLSIPRTFLLAADFRLTTATAVDIFALQRLTDRHHKHRSC